MPLLLITRFLRTVIFLNLILIGPAQAQNFTVDCARWAGPPLIKTKFGVYQTPFWFKDHSPSTSDLSPLLHEAGVHDLRYEMGWGKPDTYAFDQISGTVNHLTYNFAPLDPFLKQLGIAGITPLLAMTYDPLPLKTGKDWQRWKEAPQDLTAWQAINQNYAAHYSKVLGLPTPYYEMWNEPDLPGDGGKVFFNGDPDQYSMVYASGAEGIRKGDPDARVGGAAAAYDNRYIAAAVKHGADFASIHAYANYPVQIGLARDAVRDYPKIPIFLTEYASYTDFGLHKPNSQYPAAAAFFHDVQGLLTYPDVPKVYWAQWIDDNLGMLTDDLHRKALFNAYKIYQTQMPVDRNLVTTNGPEDGVRAIAGSDAHTVGTVLWNETAQEKTVALTLTHLPFAQGSAKIYRIDADHGSWGDDPAAENLAVTQQFDVTARTVSWSTIIPAQGTVYLHITDGTGQSLLHPSTIGKYLRTEYWCGDRSGATDADFDPQTSIFRVGLEKPGNQITQIGTLIQNPPPRLHVQVTKQGPFSPQGPNALFGIRIDYGSQHGGYSQSLLIHSGTYSSARHARLPWGKDAGTPKEGHPDKAIFQRALRDNGSFVLNLASNAPPDWNGRVLLTALLQDMGAASRARLVLSR